MEFQPKIEYVSDVLLIWEGIDILRKITSFDSSNVQGKVVQLMRDFLEANPPRICRGVSCQDLCKHKPKDTVKVEKTKRMLDETD